MTEQPESDLTLDGIARVEFHERLRGYDPDEVDAFLERVAASIARHLSDRGEVVPPQALRSVSPLTGRDAGAAQFSKRLRGYDPGEVDAFVARAASKLRALESDADP